MTRYELFKKRIAPALFLALVAWIAYDTCESHERTHATIVVDLGDAESRVTLITAELVVQGEVIGHFERKPLSADVNIGCPCTFKTAMPDQSGELRFAIVVDGKRRTLTKQIHAIEGGTVKVDLGRDLAPR